MNRTNTNKYSINQINKQAHKQTNKINKQTNKQTKQNKQTRKRTNKQNKQIINSKKYPGSTSKRKGDPLIPCPAYVTAMFTLPAVVTRQTTLYVPSWLLVTY
jgi:hypothetical protein